MLEEKAEGWAWLTNGRKRHYFRDTRSLCGKWAYGGKDLENDDIDDPFFPGNCMGCQRKRWAELKKETPCPHP